MGLNEEEKRALVNLQLEKANRFLKQAEMVRELEQWDLAANLLLCLFSCRSSIVHS